MERAVSASRGVSAVPLGSRQGRGTGEPEGRGWGCEQPAPSLTLTRVYS